MRNQRINVRKFLIIVLCCSVALTGCMFCLLQRPGKGTVTAWFQTHKSDVLLVTECLLQLDYDSCCVWDASGKVYYMGNEIPVENMEFYHAVKRLFRAGCDQISRQDTTIEFVLWTTFDVRGIAYSPNYEVPKVQFLTECEPIEGETDWYYYVDDYEKWRVSGTPAFHFGDDGQ